MTPRWVPPVVGFLAGALFLRIIDRVLPHLHPDLMVAEGPKTGLHRTTLPVPAITLHNLPEGLAVDVAFGAVAHVDDAARQAHLDQFEARLNTIETTPPLTFQQDNRPGCPTARGGRGEAGCSRRRSTE